MKEIKKLIIKFSVTFYVISALMLCGSDSDEIYKMIISNFVGIGLLFLFIFFVNKTSKN